MKKAFLKKGTIRIANAGTFFHNYRTFKLINIQGDPNQNLKFVLAITPKICISDPMLVKPKCV